MFYNWEYFYKDDTVKPVLSSHSKRRPKSVFKTDYHWMQVKSIAECSKESILPYFRPSLRYHLPLRSLFCLFLSGPLRPVLLYLVCFWLFQAISKAVYKGMLSLMKAFIHGLETTFQNYGLGGMASAYMVLEIAHTHCWTKEHLGSNKSDTSLTPEVNS